ncbi:hypothetical protein B9Z19DRAFT_1120701 [Tuber borchii]|uniref:Core Histone H2A/H2B/H3 domain-containing protein n=1 Tax=Tuber borchii TaxID=42251 RepID=A0A2T7A414_TUBBO|nr:hypothetical protein B9Z19DRAFT_1120701 [Tuber borchii]
MALTCRENHSLLGPKGGRNWGPPTRNLAACEVSCRQGCNDGNLKVPPEWGYLIPKAPFYRLCQEIVADLTLEQQFHWQRSAVECLQVAAEEFIFMIITAGVLGAAQAGRITLIVQD